MSLNNTKNLIQVEGGEKIKQADKGSYLSFQLTDTKRNVIEGLDRLSAEVVLYDKYNNRKWSTRSTVNGSIVRFKLPGNLAIGVYDLDITVSNMVFPSDRSVKIQVVEGSLTTSSSLENAEDPIFELSGYAKIEDLDKKVDKVSGKGLSTNDFSNTYKAKIDKIPTSAKYTDTTYNAGTGIDLTGNTFSIDDTVALKIDLTNIEASTSNIDIVNDLTTGGVDKALSAEQGKVLFQSVDSGKDLIAKAIIDKEGQASKEDTFSDLASKIKAIKTGYGVGDVIAPSNLKAMVSGESTPMLDWESTEHANFINSVAVDALGNVYSGSYDKKIMKISPSGTKIWEFSGNTSYVNSVVVDNQENVYSGSGDNKVFKIKQEGDTKVVGYEVIKWLVYFTMTITRYI